MSALPTDLYNMSEIKRGFAPFYGKDAKLLILGSFPSVKSRQTNFYYGNSQNRFWRVLSEFFGENTPENQEEKEQFLIKHQIALWDIVTECEIVGSQDSTIKSYVVADIKNLLQKNDFCLIILNGRRAAEIFCENYADISVPYIKLPSTSPANARFSKEEWFCGLSRVFKRS